MSRTRNAHARYSEVVGGYELSVVRADGVDNVFDVIGAIGLGILVLTTGSLGWEPDITEARWLVRVRDQSETDDARTVQTAFSRRGAMRAARRIRRVLSSGDQHAIQALRDIR